ncbi:MAG TPA: hypothetical protein VHY57_08255, partial [Rhizomicrobium sp.]|nr:hypothetical protein [Rhizomicrobium sp.]
MRLHFTLHTSHFPLRRSLLLPILAAALLLAAALPLALAQTPPPAPDAPSAQDEAIPPANKAAVERALAFLKSQQRPDGSFLCGASAGTTAVPSLVAMAFMAHGDVPGQGTYGDVINKAIDYILDSQKPTGIISRNPPGNVMYEHGISTVMLAEAYGMVDDNRRARIDQALA